MKKLLGFALVAGLALLCASLWSGSRAEATDRNEADQAQAGKGDAGAAPAPGAPSTPKRPPSTGAPAKADAGPLKK